MPAASIEDIVRALEEDIIFARLQPRERLVEDALIRRFGAKRHVVRAALSELERMGIVTRVQNKGAVVRDYTLEDVDEIYEMRELLQERAARRIPLPAPGELTARLGAVNEQIANALERGDLPAIYRLNNDFHDALFGACGNRHLADAVNHYAWLSHSIRSYRIARPDLFHLAIDEHAAMIEALASGDRKALVRLCVDHIKPSREAYLATRVALEKTPRSRRRAARARAR